MTERDPYVGKRSIFARYPWLNFYNMAAAVIVLAIIVAFFSYCVACRGTQTIDQADYGAVFLDARDCAAKHSGDSAVARETLSHLVNGGIHIASVDSMHKILGNDQLVEAVTHTEIHAPDTSVSIFMRANRRDVLMHELANAFVARHRAALLGDSAKAQTSDYYKACVEYCPNCSGAY